MPGISKKTFFKQNGKVLKNSQANTVYKEKVVSLFEPVLMVKPQRFKALRNYISTISNPNTKIVFGSISLALLIVLMFPFFTSIFRNSHPLTKTNGYSIFSSKPLTLETSTQDVDYKDSRAQKINEIFKAYRRDWVMFLLAKQIRMIFHGIWLLQLLFRNQDAERKHLKLTEKNLTTHGVGEYMGILLKLLKTG
jgi:hypothetical protein